jgi:hypothetical protein
LGSLLGEMGLTMSEMWFDIVGMLFIICGSAIGIWLGSRA